MPKLKKEKFKLNGDFIPEQTTFPEQIEIYSYYDVSKNEFYFQIEDLRKLFPHLLINDFGDSRSLILSDEDEDFKKPDNYRHVTFSGCDTKEKAVAVVQALLRNYSKTKRMLRVELQIHANTDKKEKELPKHLQNMLGFTHLRKTEKSEDDIRLGLSFKRVLKIEIGDMCAYEDCDDNWKQTGHITGNSYYRELIEWDENTEKFLVMMREELNKMCLKVLDFFNTKTLEELKIKMENNKLLKA